MFISTFGASFYSILDEIDGNLEQLVFLAADEASVCRSVANETAIPSFSGVLFHQGLVISIACLRLCDKSKMA